MAHKGFEHLKPGIAMPRSGSAHPANPCAVPGSRDGGWAPTGAAPSTLSCSCEEATTSAPTPMQRYNTKEGFTADPGK